MPGPGQSSRGHGLSGCRSQTHSRKNAATPGAASVPCLSPFVSATGGFCLVAVSSPRAALERVQDPKLDANPQLAADLEHFCARLEDRLGEARNRSKRQSKRLEDLTASSQTVRTGPLRRCGTAAAWPQVGRGATRDGAQSLQRLALACLRLAPLRVVLTETATSGTPHRVIRSTWGRLGGSGLGVRTAPAARLVGRIPGRWLDTCDDWRKDRCGSVP